MDASGRRNFAIQKCQILATGLTAFACLLGWSATAAACEIVDAYSAVANLATAMVGASPADELRAYQQRVMDIFPGLYTSSVIGLSAGGTRDAAILASLAEARESRTRTQLVRRLREEIARASKAFAVFTDFRCNFPIYIADTLGQLDGAGRVVDGQRSLVLGVGNLDAEQALISLPVLITHEMFHRYHYLAAGYSDDLADKQPIWMALWVEGLATYASQVLTPQSTTREALLLPNDLEQRAAPMLRQLAGDLLPHLDETNSELFTAYFTYGNTDPARHAQPSRAGYYVGFIVARELSRRHSLSVLAHMKGPALHGKIAEVLSQLSK